MHSLSSVGEVVASSHQDASPHAVAAAVAAYEELKCHVGPISVAEMTAVNTHLLTTSPEAALAYCQGVNNIVLYAVDYNEGNRIVAGVVTVERVLLAMNSYVQDQSVQYWGAYSLAGLACGNYVNISHLLALGGLDTLFNAADAHPESNSVQVYVCYALYCISKISKDVKAEVMTSRAVYVAKRAMEGLPCVEIPELLS